MQQYAAEDENAKNAVGRSTATVFVPTPDENKTVVEMFVDKSTRDAWD